jgi:teichuronic acid biosynthesis glycosyltransferase TuaC
MKVLVVSEYYPRAAAPALGIWAHRQALAARAAGAELRVLVLERPLPPLAALRRPSPPALLAPLRQPVRDELDGVPVHYLRYLSPPRPWSYGSWGAWAAARLAPALRRLRREFAYELIHAHYAVPAGDAVRRAQPAAPLVLSVHGHDVFGEPRGGRAIAHTMTHARVVLANSQETARRCTLAGARRVRVVHLGADLPTEASAPPAEPTLVTLGNLVPRKRHSDVLEAMALLAPTHPRLRYEIIGDGPAGPSLRAQADRLGLRGRVRFRGVLPPAAALAAVRAGTLFVLPSREEAFGVAYVEAMAGGVPAVGCRGEAGPQEIAAAGGGMVLVAPEDPAALARCIAALLEDPPRLAALRAAARATVAQTFTWSGCGEATLAAYREALAA